MSSAGGAGLWFDLYKGMIAYQYGALGAAMVAEVEAGRKTPEEFFEVLSRALAEEPCGECGRE